VVLPTGTNDRATTWLWSSDFGWGTVNIDWISIGSLIARMTERWVQLFQEFMQSCEEARKQRFARERAKRMR
jgi:hypothetical protein